MQKLIFTLTLIFSTAFLHAQTNSSFHFTLNHISLSVKNADSAVSFYKKVLELQEITNRTRKSGIRWMSLGEDKELHLISTIKEPYTINKAIHLGLAADNFDSFVKRLDSLKIPYSDWPGIPHTVTIRNDGIKQIYFQDLDGYWIEVNNTVK